MLNKREEENNWKALFVFMQMDEIKGHPPCGPDAGVYNSHTLAWGDICNEKKSKIETDPYVLIVGAGHGGLNMGAKLKSLNIPTLIIDRLPRVGDSWRMRYPTLSLHTVRTHHSLLFQKFPENWPIYTPKDKMADWLEQYSKSQDLVVWNDTTLESSVKPTFDEKSKRWHLAVTREGKEVTLHPAHIILATGVLGSPRIPLIKNQPVFSGEVFHASKFQGGKPYKGKHILVVGAGKTSADISQDCAIQGAEKVTLLQHSSTCVISSELMSEFISTLFPEGEDTEVSDFKYQAFPIGLQRQWAIEDREKREKADEDPLRKLTSKGVKLNQGKDGSGQYFLALERFGGFWVDVGLGELIGDDRVQVKSGVELDHFLPDGVVFTDGSKLEVDFVIYATGYHDAREDLKHVFGEDIMTKTSSLRLNQEDELGFFNPSGQAGLWFAAGDCGTSRAFTKQLGLQIQAWQLGLITDEPSALS